jgi:hypothetical protein
MTVAPQHGALPARAKTIWLGLGAASLMVCVVGAFTQRSSDGLAVGRQQAADAARTALERRGASLGDSWRVMPVPDDGSGGPHEFVSETAGEERRRALLGTYLPASRWNVRAASFEGDVADRAEEWQIIITAQGEARSSRHTLPEGRAGASLDEDAARRLAIAALSERLGVGPGGAGMKELSALPSKLKARTDWAFTFLDTTVAPLPMGEPRVGVEIAGDEVTAAYRYVFVPEEWERLARATGTRNSILQILVSVVFGSPLVGAGILGIIAWSRRQYTPRLFFAGAGLMLVVSIARAINAWPTFMASLPTIAPLTITVPGVAAIGFVGLAIVAVFVGLPIGHAPSHRAACGRMPMSDAQRLAVAAGLFGAAAAAVAGWLMTPAWAQFPDIAAFGTLVPVVQAALNPLAPLLTQTATLLAVVLGLERLTRSWSRRRALAIGAMAAIGFLGAGAPIAADLGGWVAAGLVTSTALTVLYVTLIRFDLSMIPLAVATAAAVEAIGKGAQGPFPGALMGSVAGAVLALLTGWWLFRALRKASMDAATAGVELAREEARTLTSPP